MRDYAWRDDSSYLELRIDGKTWKAELRRGIELDVLEENVIKIIQDIFIVERSLDG